MQTEEAVKIAREWLAHLDRQKERSEKLQRLAALARTDPEQAQREKRRMDMNLTVYDGARLQPAVEQLIRIADATLKAAGVSDE